MLILCSDGLTSPHLLERVRSLTHECHTAALVVTADPVYKEKNYHVPRCVQELRSLGLHVTIIDLDVDAAEILAQYDVVEFIGGNPYYLLTVIRTADCTEILRDIAHNKVLIGWSAAAAVFGPTLELIDQYTPEMNLYDLIDLSGISLTNQIVLPHYSKFLRKFDQFEELCKHFELTNHKKVIRLNDGDGIFINVSTFELCSHDTEVIQT